MTQEELIAEARIRYPIGTTVILLPGYDGRDVKYKIDEYTWTNCSEYTRTDNRKVISYNGCPGYFYYEEEWAQIESLPETNLFPIY